MLILSRKVEEAIRIGHRITVRVVKIGGKKGKVVRLGVEAPEEVSVHRQEVYDRIRSKDRGLGNSTASVHPHPRRARARA